eukprot:g2833.t1
MAAGWFAGLVNVAVGHPFDTGKVRAQARMAEADGGLRPSQTSSKTGGKRPSAVGHAAAHRLQNAGAGLQAVRVLYRGIQAPLLTTGLSNALMFGSWRYFKEELEERESPKRDEEKLRKVELDNVSAAADKAAAEIYAYRHPLFPEQAPAADSADTQDPAPEPLAARPLLPRSVHTAATFPLGATQIPANDPALARAAALFAAYRERGPAGAADSSSSPLQRNPPLAASMQTSEGEPRKTRNKKLSADRRQCPLRGETRLRHQAMAQDGGTGMQKWRTPRHRARRSLLLLLE